MKIAVILAAFSLSCLVNQGENVMFIKSFLRSISNYEVTQEKIIQDYLYLTPDTDTSKHRQKVELIKLQLGAVKDSLKGKDFAKFAYIPYRLLPRNEQVINIDNILKDNIYIIKYNNAYFTSILIKEGKISSFATMNKGGRRVFLLN